MTIPPAGCKVAFVTVPVLWPGFQSWLRTYVCAAGDTSLNDGVDVYA
jgi:hypothetical protein